MFIYNTYSEYINKLFIVPPILLILINFIYDFKNYSKLSISFSSDDFLFI